MIEHKLYMKNTWFVLLQSFHLFCVDLKSKMATTSGQN